MMSPPPSPLPAQVTVRVPASTSNCGAGFDTLGIGLSLYNFVRLGATTEPGLELEAGTDPRARAMAEEAAAAFFADAGRAPHGWKLGITGEVPVARGLGSSVTVIAGVIAGLNALHGEPLARGRIVGLTTRLEGHPDNASSAVLGGFCASRCDPATGEYLATIQVPVDANLVFVVVSPEVEMLTKAARDVLPKTLPYPDAVRSVNASAFLTAAFATGRYEDLKHARGDFLHEPYRLPRIPGARESIAAGLAAGALTGWLSGSGSSVLCVAGAATAAAVSAGMQRAFADQAIACQPRLLRADNEGLRWTAAR